MELRTVVLIFVSLLLGLIYAKRYTGGTTPIGQMGSLVRYSMYALVAWVGVNLILFHSLGSVQVALAWIVFPMLAIILRQTAAFVLGHSGMWSSPALLVGSAEATATLQAMLLASPRPVFHIVRTVVGDSLPDDFDGVARAARREWRPIHPRRRSGPRVANNLCLRACSALACG